MNLKIDAEMDLDEAEVLEWLNSRPNQLAVFSKPFKKKRTVEAASRLQRELRQRMDAWIETGRSPEGREQPAKRSVEKLEEQTYHDGHGGLSPLLRDWYWYGSQVPPRAKLQSRSGSTLVALNFGDTNREPSEAATMMLKILLSDFRFRIAKCRYCERYCALREIRPKKAYANGTFCKTAHNRAWSARKRTFDRRAECMDKQLEWAATKLVSALRSRRSNTPWWKDDALLDELVRAVNRQLVRFASRTVDQIKRNWITLHRVEIQNKASEPVA